MPVRAIHSVPLTRAQLTGRLALIIFGSVSLIRRQMTIQGARTHISSISWAMAICRVLLAPAFSLSRYQAPLLVLWGGARSSIRNPMKAFLIGDNWAKPRQSRLRPYGSRRAIRRP